MTFSSTELNHLIYRYLYETGLQHSAYVFGEESQAAYSNFNGVAVASGTLVHLVQLGLFYLEAEADALNGVFNGTTRKRKSNSMTLLDGAVLIKRHIDGVTNSPAVTNSSGEDMDESHASSTWASSRFTTSSPASPPSVLTAVESKSEETGSQTDSENQTLRDHPRHTVDAETLENYFHRAALRSGPLESLPSLNSPSPQQSRASKAAMDK